MDLKTATFLLTKGEEAATKKLSFEKPSVDR